MAARKLSVIVRTQPYTDNRTGEIRKLATEILCWRWRTINNRNGEEKDVDQLSLRSLRSLKSGFHIIAMIAAIAEPFFLSDNSDHMETRLKLSAMDDDSSLPRRRS